VTVRDSKVLTVVLTKALLRSAALLDLSGSQLAAVLGVSEATISRMAHGTVKLKRGSKEAELATLLVRCFHALDALVGGNDEQRRKWMATYNAGLNGIPRELVTTAEGLVRTVSYLDHVRNPL
jgi:DNA-binding Xre family transcriptional regulator